MDLKERGTTEVSPNCKGMQPESPLQVDGDRCPSIDCINSSFKSYPQFETESSDIETQSDTSSNDNSGLPAELVPLVETLKLGAY